MNKKIVFQMKNPFCSQMSCEHAHRGSVVEKKVELYSKGLNLNSTQPS